ncbi:HalOD1 output domain-containing protein [Halorubrum sp. HHNYT27]|uniref:HalOD1 output domain-containing protein n=1 Tax=Halorubrum sp. HHNYT27 TaxID=3402275 RepID=UPI003EB96EAF
MNSDIADTLCWDIVTTVAEERDIEPDRIDDRLYDVIDVESLARLVEQAQRVDTMDLSVSFRMAGCFVTVTGERTVRASAPN